MYFCIFLKNALLKVCDISASLFFILFSISLSHSLLHLSSFSISLSLSLLYLSSFSISLSHSLLHFSSCFPSLFPTLYCTVLQFDISAVLFFLCRVIGIGNAKRSSRNVLQILVKLLYFLVSVLIFPNGKLTFKNIWLDLLKLKKRVERRKFQV
jgi:hypothetical protein